MSNSSGFALTLAVTVGVVYLLILRVVDHNEKAPVWALLLMLGVGVVGALLLSVLVSARTQHATTALASVADELTIFIALFVGVGLLEAVGKLRGWSELNGPVGGIIYGGAVGLGFATGDALVTQLHGSSGLVALIATSPLDTLWPTLLSGMAFGLFGSLIGGALGAAVDARGAKRILLPLAGLVIAFVVQVAYLVLAHDNPASGSAKVREWIALLLPAAFFLALSFEALRSERKVITGELAGDPQACTPAELALLTNPAARRAAYLARLARVDAHGWLGLRSMQNRQVQLALTKRRAGRTDDAHRRAELEQELARLRAAVVAARDHLATGPGAVAPAPGAVDPPGAGSR